MLIRAAAQRNPIAHHQIVVERDYYRSAVRAGNTPAHGAAMIEDRRVARLVDNAAVSVRNDADLKSRNRIGGKPTRAVVELAGPRSRRKREGTQGETTDGRGIRPIDEQDVCHAHLNERSEEH